MLKNGNLDINPPERQFIREAYRKYVRSGRVTHFIELNRVSNEIGGEGLAVVVTLHAARAREHRCKPTGKDPCSLDSQIKLYREALHARRGIKINGSGNGMFTAVRRMLGLK